MSSYGETSSRGSPKNDRRRSQNHGYLSTFFIYSLNYLRYLLRTLLMIYVGFLTNWTQIFAHPVNTLLLITVFPFLHIFFALAGILVLFLDLIGLGRFLDRLTDTFAGGSSIANWLDLRLFDDNHPEAFQALETENSRLFNPKVASALSLFTALVYEPNDKIRQVAENWGFRVKDGMVKPHGDSEGEVDGEDGEVEGKGAKGQQQQQQRDGLAKKVQQNIEHMDKETQVKIFHKEGKTKEDPILLIVTFRGTSPRNLLEWLIDFTMIKCEGRPMLFGRVHNGFFERLFRFDPDHIVRRFGQDEQNKVSSEESKGTSGPVDNDDHPYSWLLEDIRSVLEEYGRRRTPAKLWITGHSLGGALATLFYARLMKSPGDLKSAQVVGGYTFGSPRVGDYEFSLELKNCSQIPLQQDVEKEKRLWRVVNSLDIVPRVPFGWDGWAEYIQTDAGQNLLDYTHVGTRVQLHYGSSYKVEANKPFFFWRNLGGYIYDYFFHFRHFGESIQTLVKKRDPLPLATWFTPFFLQDHAPCYYYRNLNLQQHSQQ